ncbi:MAG: HAMP domain-containing histidine kinase [Acidobacteriia bacterium]|nr:HAMP domain-containing histidine kinase [Terriglobia bacterium]
MLITLAFVVFPAAALIGFSVLHLRSIQRDRAIEAAIQRDFQHMMAITEKRMARKAYEMADEVQPKVPCSYDSDAGARLQAMLDKHPHFAQIFTWSKGKGTVVRSQSRYTNAAEVHAEGEKLGTMITGWFDLEGALIVEKLRTMQSKGERPYMPHGEWITRNGKPVYQAFIFFPINENKAGIGGVVFDPDFLQDKFFPEMMNTMMAESEVEAKKDNSNTRSEAVMMIHAPKEPPLAACSDWDGGMPEMERKLEAGFPGLMLAMKFRGTTVEAIGQKFLRTSFLVLGGLSLLLAAGIVFTYRGVNKEMELAKTKSDFVSNVSHELRTPLALIRLYAETLELGRVSLPDKQHEYYCTIRKESERLTALINNILDFSRIEAGRKEYDFRATNLPELVRTTLESYRYQIEQHGFRFEEHIADDIPPVVVDREAIARSLLNLVNNAIKYSSDNRYLAVSLRRTNGSVKLEVVDHGIGISRDEQSKIFEKFYRVSDPLVHNTKGSGLGLCLVRHIAHAHGGDVSVESTPGKGSKFSLVLPVEPPVAAMRNSGSKPDIGQGVGVA